MFTVFRFFLRVLGCFLIAAALVAIIADGSRSIAQSELVLVSAGQFWTDVAPSSLEQVKLSLQQSETAFFFYPVLQAVLAWPLWLVCSLYGALSLWLGSASRRRPASFAI